MRNLKSENSVFSHLDGLTTRQHFASMAMQAIASGIYSNSNLTLMEAFSLNAEANGITVTQEIASRAVIIADSLIAELNKEVTNEKI